MLDVAMDMYGAEGWLRGRTGGWRSKRASEGSGVLTSRGCVTLDVCVAVGVTVFMVVMDMTAVRPSSTLKEPPNGSCRVDG